MPTILNSRCPLCPNRYLPVCGDGPKPCKIAFWGEEPGYWENREGLPFCGDSGRELDYQYMPIAGLYRPDVYVSNAVKCWLGKGNPTPSDELIASCSRHWMGFELAEVQPEIIVTLGASSGHLFQGLDLELDHGIPREGVLEFADWKGVHFPSYHPAAGLRDPNFMIRIREDFASLRRFLHGTYEAPVDIRPRPYYAELTTEDEMMESIPAERWIEVAVDTESVSGRIYSLSYSFEPGIGYFVQVSTEAGRKLAGMLWKRLHELRAMWIFHAALHDLGELSQIDLWVPPRRFRDTMVRAYHLAMPQSLKTLAYRLCGMVMEDYLDLVMPYSEGFMLDYLEKVSKLGQADLPNYERRPRQSPIWKRSGRIINEVLTKGAKPIDRWYMLPEEERMMVEAVLGSPPLAGVHQVPRDRLIHYASRDADATIRIDPILAARLRELRRAT